jgi:glucan phosphoethanolaminetransferase (alkaline phosphatase superfamily)
LEGEVTFYPWIVFVHVAAAFLFVMGHGASMWASFQIRMERDPERIRALLNMSSSSLGVVYGGLLLLLIAGIWAGIAGDHFGHLWIWLAIGVLILIIVLMYALASRYYAQVREAVGIRSMRTPKDAPDPTPVSPEELAALLDTRRPDVIGLVGVIGLLVLLWLMFFKPF